MLSAFLEFSFTSPNQRRRGLQGGAGGKQQHIHSYLLSLLLLGVTEFSSLWTVENTQYTQYTFTQ